MSGDRCCRVVISSKAKLAHIQSSSSHNPCTLCLNRPDFLSRSILRDNNNSHYFPCDDCTIVFSDPGRLQDYQYKAHRHCNDCGEFLRIRITCTCTSNVTSPGRSSATANTAMSPS